MIECPNCRRLIRSEEHAIEVYYCLGPTHTDQGLIEGHNIRQNTAGQIIIAQDCNTYWFESYLTPKSNFMQGQEIRATWLKVAERMGYHDSVSSYSRP
jgi:hypothetical protein